MFLMPSRFEPCGLNQMYSLRYGTLPIVRAVGGLKDTVEDAVAPPAGPASSSTTTRPERWCRRFGGRSTAYGAPERWTRMQQTAMARDCSWDVSAREYVKVYSANS